MAFIYKTTNIINNKIYVGKSSSNDPSYLGSGEILAEAIKKYGRDSFKKEIIVECSDDEVDEQEILWIEILKARVRNNGYNIAKGGTGGDTTSTHPDRDSIVEQRTKSLQEWHDSLTETEKMNRGQKISIGKKGKSNGREGYTHSEDSKRKIQENQPEKTDEWRKSHADAMAKRKGKSLTAKYKAVIINDVAYDSIKSACDSLGIKHRASLYQGMKSGKYKVIYK